MKIDYEGFFSRVQESLPDLSVQAVADKLGLTKQAIYSWQKGTIPKAEVLAAIAESNSISLHWLLTGDGPKYLLDGEALMHRMTEAERAAIEEMAESGDLTFADTIVYLAREALAAKTGIAASPMTVVPVIETIPDEIYDKIERLPRSAKAKLLGDLMTKVVNER